MCVRNFSFVVSFVYIINAQIALPTFQAVHKPHNISSSTAVGAVIAADLYHMGAILANGTVKFWGYNGQGQLGQGNTTTIGNGPNQMGDNLEAIDLGTGRTAIDISAGIYHAGAVLDNGMVKVWGYNAYGQLGQGNNTRIGTGADDMGDNLSAIDLGTGRTATAIEAGLFFSLAILDDGTG